MNVESDSDHQREYYSGKKKRHTVKTQVVTTAQGQIAAITPVQPGKVADIELAKQSRIVERLPEDCEVYDDKGYQGLTSYVPPKPVTPVSEAPVNQEEAQPPQPRVLIHTPTKKPRGGELTAEQQERNRAISKVRIFVEHAIGRIKNWRILAERFRCALTIYTEVFRTIAGLVNSPKQVCQPSLL